MALLAFELLIRTMWGAFLTLLFANRVETSERFLKIAFWIAFSLALCAQLVSLPLEFSPTRLGALSAFIMGAFFYSFFSARIPRIFALLCLLSVPFIYIPVKNLAHLFNFASGAIVVGGILAAQYLGHWYLTVAGLSIKELSRVTKLLQFGLGIKAIEMLYALWIRRNAHLENLDPFGQSKGIDIGTGSANPARLFESYNPLALNGEGYFGLGFFGQVLLVSRVLWGFVAPLILIFLVQKTLKSRSTQSATGILYAMSVMVLFGEAIALYLLQKLGWYI